MSDDAKPASGTDVPKAATDKAKKNKKKKGDSEKAPISQAVPPVVRRRNKPDSVAPAAAADPAKAAAGKDAADKNPAGKDAAGKDAAEKNAAGKDAAGKDAAGKDAAGKDAAGKDAAKAGKVAAKSDAKPSAEAVAKSNDDGAAKADGQKAADKTDAPPPSSKKAPEGPAAALARKAAEARAAAAKAGIELPAPVEPPVSPAADGSVAVTDASLDAELRSGAARKSRRARKSRAVRTTDVPAETPKSEDGNNEERPRRKRRERRRGRDDERPRRDARGPRDRGPRDGKRRDSRGDAGSVAAVGQTTGRRIYKQDVSPQVAAAQAEAAKKAAEDERKRKLKETQDKVTLILHPAPKAGKTKHKKKGRPLTAKEALKAKTAAKSKAKARSEDTPETKEVSLDAKWVSADGTSAADALKSAGAGAEALVKAWLEASNVEALAAAAQSKHKGRKAAKRALNVLRSRGVEIPKTEPTSPVVREEAHEIVALFIPPDSTGATFFSISQRQPGGRYHVVDVVVRSGVGVVHANSAKLAGKHIRGWQNRVEKQYGTKPVKVPTDWARHHVAAGRKLNDVSKQLVPLGYDSCASLLRPVPETAPAHPLAHLLEGEPAAKDIEAAVTSSEELHGQPEFGSWLPDRPALDELLAKVGERVGPEGVKDSAKVDEAIRVEVAAATDRWFTPERRTILADSMTDCAISVHAREGDDTAQRVVTVARAIRDAGLITSPPSEIPFLLHFFQKAVAYLVRQNQGQLRVPIPAQA